MANQNQNQNQQGQNGGNQNRQRGGANTAQPSNKVTMSVNSQDQVIGSACEILFEVSVFRGTSALAGEKIVLKDGSSNISQRGASGKTGTNGIVALKVKFNLTDVAQQKILRIILDGTKEEISYPIILPAKEKKPVKKDEAENMIIFKHQKGGKLTFKARVLRNDHTGLLNKTVKVFYRGDDYFTKTDEDGETVFYPKPDLKKGEEQDIIFTVSGIEEEVKLRVSRKKDNKQPKAFNKGWWLGVNNGRAFITLLIAIALWAFAFSVGIGRAGFSNDTFRGKDGLSKIEQLYNRTAADYGQEIKPSDKSEDYILWGSVSKSSIWIWALVMTFASLVYLLISAREEVAEAIEEAKMKLVEKKRVKVGDPLFEQIIATASSIGVARRNNGVQFGPSASTSSSTGQASSDKEEKGSKKKSEGASSFWSGMPANMMVEFVAEIAAGSLARVFRRN